MVFVTNREYRKSRRFATTFTLSCSSDDDGGGDGGSNSSQIYTFEGKKEPFNGNGDIFVRLWCDDGAYEDENYGDKYDLLPAGNIRNGKISLNLPPSIDNKYLRSSLHCFNENDCNLSVVPQDLTDTHADYLVATIPGRSDCRIVLGEMDGLMDGSTGISFVYSSAFGTVTGTRSEENLNLNLSQGWNFIYWYRDKSVGYLVEYFVTTLPTGTTLEWFLGCNN